MVTGGYVYRGPDPSLQGKYFFLDSRNSASTADDNYWMFDPGQSVRHGAEHRFAADAQHRFAAVPGVVRRRRRRQLYIAYLVTGDVYRINDQRELS